MGPLAIAGIGAGIAGLTGLIGGERANAANAKEAQKNRDFQERMSNTQYQRGVKDLSAAGLNPALAYQQGGAGTPTGSSAAGSQTNTLGGIGSSAQTALSLLTQKAQIENIQADTFQKDTETRLAAQRANYEFPNILARTKLLDTDIFRQTQENMYVVRKLEQALTNAIAEGNLTAARAAGERLTQYMNRLGIPELRAESEFYTGLGKYTPYVGGAKSLIDLFPSSLGKLLQKPANVRNYFLRK